MSPPPDARRIGLKDVAALAGVSAKTVSNVVNGYVHVSEGTRERVQQALDQLNYRPNVSARNLRNGRTGLIALVVPELDLPYFAELARSVIRAAEPHGWTVLIDQTDGVAAREQVALDGIRGHLLDGVIFSPIATGADELAARRDTTPLVLLGERVSDGPLDHVVIDNVAAAAAATEHLLASGRRRIAAVGLQESVVARTAHLRLRGYRRALAAAGLAEDPSLMVPVEAYHRADGAGAVHRLIDAGHRPDGLFCFNDMLALGAMRALLERGVRVPDDVAVVGWDDIEDGRYSTPSLSTIRPDKTQIAELAVSLLASRLRSDSDGPPREEVAAFDLMVRESSASTADEGSAPQPPWSALSR